MGKRSRSEDRATGLAQQLEAAAQDLAKGLNGDDKRVLKALAAVRASIDASDEQYKAQTSFAAGGCLDALSKLLDADSSAVSIAAAETLQMLTQHSPAVLDRLVVGGNFTMGNPESVSFNPLQSDVDHATITKLVGLQFEGSPDQQDAAFSTLAALSVYNRSNKLANLKELVRRLVDGQLSAGALVETTLDSMDFKDDVAVIVDQALASILQSLSEGTPKEQRPAVSLLGVVIAKRPAIAEYLVGEGALKAAVALLASGDARMADAAAAAVWGLVKDHPHLLRPESEELGVSAASLVPPLVDIINRSEVSGPEVEGDEASVSGSDNGEAASALLKALAIADPAVRKVMSSGAAAPAAVAVEAKPARCSIM